ncbi:MAG: LPS translocon maturation chaperone LptM [Thiobacillaceae bacterium]
MRLKILVLVLLLLAAGGCGKKGALYLPEPSPQSPPSTPTVPNR